jgi:hypothetical protein
LKPSEQALAFFGSRFMDSGPRLFEIRERRTDPTLFENVSTFRLGEPREMRGVCPQQHRYHAGLCL